MAAVEANDGSGLKVESSYPILAGVLERSGSKLLFKLLETPRRRRSPSGMRQKQSGKPDNELDSAHRLEPSPME
jgi:hypothetical protein